MAFNNDIVSYTELLRPAIQSANYVPGVSGWTINRDGTSEFASGTFRGPVVILDPSSGVVLASIGADGNGSFQYVYVQSDLIIGTLSVLAAIEAATRGLVGYYNTTGTLPALGDNSSLTDIMWCNANLVAGRAYRVWVGGMTITNPDSIDDETVLMQISVAQVGSGGFSGTVGYSSFYAQNKEPTRLICEGVFNATITGASQVKLQACTVDTVTWSAPTALSGGATIYVEDIGPSFTLGGGTGSPSGSQQYTTVYPSNASRSWDGSGNYIGAPDGVDNMYQGTLSGRSHGTECSMWCFDGGQVATDIAGATIQSAKLYMYCTNSSGSSGGSYVSLESYSVPPSGAPGTSTSGANYSSSWPVPGWGSIDITAWLSSITSSKCAVYLQHAIIDGSASWYGFGTPQYAPYIQITYTK
jgi:hypothetical protein